MTNYFNVGAFFVLFRESVEAAVILSVLLAFVDRSVSDNETQKSLKKQVWWGTLAGIVISLIIGVSLTVTFYVLGKDVFGDAEPLWEGILQSLAVILLTWLAFRMLQVNSLIAKWEGKIQNHLNERNMMEKGIPYFSNAYSLFILAFTVVIREGLEAVIFIAGVGQADPVSLIIPSIVGLFTGLTVGYVLYKGSSRVNLGLFFKISFWIILFIAAGLAARAAHEIEEYVFETASSGEESTRVLWDVSGCCSQKTNGFFQIMNALVGWRSIATIATVSVYFSYWFVVGLIALFLNLKNSKKSFIPNNPESIDQQQEKEMDDVHTIVETEI